MPLMNTVFSVAMPVAGRIIDATPDDPNLSVRINIDPAQLTALIGRMPLKVDSGVGHIDRFIQWVFRCSIEELDTSEIVGSEDDFERLCRVIMLTEQRGYAQVGIILKNKLIMSDPIMKRIFEIVHKDEPDHFLPYQRWLERQGRATAKWNERAADWTIHKILMLAKLPALFLDAGRPRLERWPDEDDAAYAR